MDRYLYEDPPEIAMRGLLPEGDYTFIVAEVTEPRLNPNKNWVLNLKLSIQPDGTPVWANPWSRSKESAVQDGRNQIAEFLVCINRTPKKGTEPDWDSLVGAKGKCRLIVEPARDKEGNLTGKEKNSVHYFYTVKNTDTKSVRKSVSASEFEKARIAQRSASGGEPEQDDVPY